MPQFDKNILKAFLFFFFFALSIWQTRVEKNILGLQCLLYLDILHQVCSTFLVEFTIISVYFLFFCHLFLALYFKIYLLKQYLNIHSQSRDTLETHQSLPIKDNSRCVKLIVHVENYAHGHLYPGPPPPHFSNSFIFSINCSKFKLLP